MNWRRRQVAPGVSYEEPDFAGVHLLLRGGQLLGRVPQWRRVSLWRGGCADLSWLLRQGIAGSWQAGPIRSRYVWHSFVLIQLLATDGLARIMRQILAI